MTFLVQLPMFSEVEKVRAQPAFTPPEGSKPENPLEPPQVMHMTHVGLLVFNFDNMLITH